MFKYINPGFADLFDEVSTNSKQYRGSQYSRTSGDCFRITDSSSNVLYMENSPEYWAAFFYHPAQILSSGSAPIMKFQNSSYAIVLTHCYIDRSSFYFQMRDNSNTVFGTNVDLGMYYGRGYHVEIYVKDNPADGVINVWVDGQLVYAFTGKTGEGSGFDKAVFSSGGSGYEFYFSDIAIQNTGRIGDIRVNKIPASLTDMICEWDKIVVPIGNNVDFSSGTLTANRTYILSNSQFQCAGTIRKIVMQISGILNITFFIFRKDTTTEKYNFHSVTEAYPIDASGTYTLELTSPFNIEPGDYIGFFTNRNTLRESNNGAGCHYFNGNAISDGEVSFPSSTYNYAPCLFALFEPGNIEQAIRLLESARQQGIRVEDYAEFEVSAAEKKLLLKADPAKLKAGVIDSIAMTNIAHYEGQSPVTGLSPVFTSGENTAAGDRKPLTTADKNHVLGVYEKNPLTGEPWSKSDLENLQFGIVTKA